MNFDFLMFHKLSITSHQDYLQRLSSDYYENTFLTLNIDNHLAMKKLFHFNSSNGVFEGLTVTKYWFKKCQLLIENCSASWSI